MACQAFLQGTFPTQGSNPPLLHHLHRQVGSLPLEPLPHQGLLFKMEHDASLSPPVMGATDAPLVLPQGAGMGAPSLELPQLSGPPRQPLPVQPISAPSSFQSSLPSQGVQSLKQPTWAPLHLPSEGDPTKVSFAPTPHTTPCTTCSVRAGRDQAPPW